MSVDVADMCLQHVTYFVIVGFPWIIIIHIVSSGDREPCSLAHEPTEPQQCKSNDALPSGKPYVNGVCVCVHVCVSRCSNGIV